MHSLGIVQWNSTRRDHPGYPGRVSGTGPVSFDPYPFIKVVNKFYGAVCWGLDNSPLVIVL